jgi:hypothetical protein
VEPSIPPYAKDVPHVYGLSESLLFAIKLLFYDSHTDHTLLPAQSCVQSTTLHHFLLWEDNDLFTINNGYEIADHHELRNAQARPH